MKYQVFLRVYTKEGQWISVGEKHPIVWTVRDLISASCGWTVLNQENIGSAKAFIPLLQRGIIELTHHESDYSNFEAMHGLGTLKDTLEFYRDLLNDCIDHPFCELYGVVTA
ncbi:hypothetical protein [Caproiciproducens faecalis]|uniref:Uncharacterized protein n=1 Tax=Caproiciproducens faecalis TaxID=2820301 RepID=A0ABS7DL07_9FIRM|nr:hypothetical protein [Caproiciproducens faecalis]MBW7571990.1 hypothetical protein [Caproiciproducens faecalis]